MTILNNTMFSDKTSTHGNCQLWINDENLSDYIKTFSTNPKKNFDDLDFLSSFTRLAAPAVKKKHIGNQLYVVKSTGIDDVRSQENEIAKALEINGLMNELNDSCDRFAVEVACPVSIVHDNETGYYSFMKFYDFPTLDNAFVNMDVDCKAHLQNIRFIYDYFLSKNIFWNDMAPRNILLDASKKSIRYIILDFEKTKHSTSSARNAEIEFWRGAVISEEFASTCDLHSILDIFGDKFNPADWDEDNSEPIQLKDMRYEIKAIIKNMNVPLTKGQYNRIDKSLVKTRFPATIKGRKIYTGKICFLIDSVLGSEYDRKFNETLLASSKTDAIEAVVDEIDKALIECGISMEDFVASKSTLSEEFDGAGISKLIDRLHESHVGSRSELSKLV